MFCGKCGEKNDDDAKFCHSCGTPLDKVGGGQEEPKKVKALPKKAIMSAVGAVAAVAALIIILSIILNGKKTINLNDFVTVEATGYDGYGTVRAKIDWDAMEEKYGSKLSFTSKAKKEYGGLTSLMTPIDLIKDCVDVELDTKDGVSNGDKISYTWDIDENLTKYVKCNVKYKDDSYSVSGLTEVGTFDAFADLEVTFSGIAPNGSLRYDYTGSELNYYDFSCDTSSELSNGDTVKITIDDDMAYYAEKLGKVPASLEKEYKVEGLNSYLLKTEDISADGLKTMQQQAEDVFNSYVAKNWEDCVSLESLTYMGNYLLTIKDMGYWGSKNLLYLVYKAQSKEEYTNGEESYNGTTDIYWYIAFRDVMVDADGELVVDVANYETVRESFEVDTEINSGWWSTKSWYYYGYQTLDELYKDVVTSNMDAYNHEDAVDASLAAAPVEKEEKPADNEDTSKTVDDAVNEYVLANSDTQLLTSADLDALTAEECKIARDEIYARHGCKFEDAEVQAYFDGCAWYTASIEAGEFDETELSDIEFGNKALIDEYIRVKGY